MPAKQCPLYEGKRRCGCHSDSYVLTPQNVRNVCKGNYKSCEDFLNYAQSLIQPSKLTQNYLARAEKRILEHRAIERAQRGLSLDNIQTTYLIKKIPYVPNAVKGRPFTRSQAQS